MYTFSYSFFYFLYFRGMNFYDRLKVLMKQKGVSTEQMMKDVFGPQATRGQYQMMKQRGFLFRLDDAYAIATYFDVSLEWLLTGEDKRDSKTPEEKLFLDLFNQLNGTAKTTILSLMTQLKNQ